MFEIYQYKPTTPLVSVAIPGTHDSATVGISYKSKVEPGSTFAYQVIKPIVASWAKTQYLSITDQLNYGIRYFDFRISFGKKGEAYISHGLVAGKATTILNEITAFNLQHPKEIVLIAYQVSWDYLESLTTQEAVSATGNATLVFKNHFGNKLMEFSARWTFNDFWNRNTSVMLLDNFQNFWPDVYKLDSVRRYLDQASKTRNPRQFSVHGLIYTPPEDLSFFLQPQNLFVMHSNQNSLSTLSKDLRLAIPSMIADWKTKGYKINIVASDFIEKIQFAGTVINLNDPSANYTTPVSLEDQVFQ